MQTNKSTATLIPYDFFSLWDICMNNNENPCQIHFITQDFCLLGRAVNFPILICIYGDSIPFSKKGDMFFNIFKEAVIVGKELDDTSPNPVRDRISHRTNNFGKYTNPNIIHLLVVKNRVDYVI